MNLRKLVLGASLAAVVTFSFATANETEAAEVWTARTVDQVKADFVQADGETSAYTIQWGDTLSVIASSANLSIDTLAQINNIANADLIQAGKQLTFKTDAAGQVKEVTVDAETFSVDTNTGYVAETSYQAPVVEEAPVEEVAYEAPAETYVAPVEEVASAEIHQAPTPQAKPVIEAAQAQPTQTGSEAEAKEWIAQRESTGSYTAYNAAGGYYGRYQLNPSLVSYGASPAEQEAAADKYVAGRYGSWTQAQSFWQANGWY